MVSRRSQLSIAFFFNSTKFSPKKDQRQYFVDVGLKDLWIELQWIVKVAYVEFREVDSYCKTSIIVCFILLWSHCFESPLQMLLYLKKRKLKSQTLSSIKDTQVQPR